MMWSECTSLLPNKHAMLMCMEGSALLMVDVLPDVVSSKLLSLLDSIVMSRHML